MTMVVDGVSSLRALLPTLLFLIFLSSETLFAAGLRGSHGGASLSACVQARYPAICFRTLSSYAGPSHTPQDLALAAVNVSLTRSRKVSRYISRIPTLRSGSKRERGALKDCVEQISDSVDELSRTLSELKHLGGGGGGGSGGEEQFRWHMSNAETWVSAALTNDDTCLDGFEGVDGKVKWDVKRRITNVSRITSNALYLINRLDPSRGRGR